MRLVEKLLLALFPLASIISFQNCGPTFESSALLASDQAYPPFPALPPGALSDIDRSIYVSSTGKKFLWSEMKVGGGGWMTGISMSLDGTTKVSRTDVYGAYIWNEDEQKWRHLLNLKAFADRPSISWGTGAGVYEVAVAPNDANRIYLAVNNEVFRSDNRGETFQKTAFTATPMNANGTHRMLGNKMAVDPRNPNVVLVGTEKDGLRITLDGGASFSKVTAIPVSLQNSGEEPGVTGIAFAPTAGAIGNRTKRIFASSYGHGVFMSDDGGATWVNLSGGPIGVRHGAVDQNGAYYVAEMSANYNTRIMRYENGAFTDITPPTTRDYHSITISPTNPSHLVAGTGGGELVQSLDRGKTWSYLWVKKSREAFDIPWLAWTNETYMSSGDMQFDPIVPNKIWFVQGIGVWTTILPVVIDSVVWTSATAGIENLCTNHIIAPPGGRPIVFSWDRAIFRIDDPEVYPSLHGPGRENPLQAGWSGDYSASDPSYMAAIVNWSSDTSSYSTDGGITWQKFATLPPFFSSWKIGGSMAVGAPGNIIWIPANNGMPYYTKDSGQTWKPAVFPGVLGSEPGFNWAYYLNRHIVAADRVNIGTFYAYNYNHGTFRSTNGGDSWQLVSTKKFEWSGYNATLKSVPGKAGHLFFTSGPLDGDAAVGALQRSTDGGASWTAVPDVFEAQSVGFGKEAPGSSYPTIYIVGWYKDQFGIYMSTDNAASFVQIGDYPMYRLDRIDSIEGDKQEFGLVYVGFSQSGFGYGKIVP